MEKKHLLKAALISALLFSVAAGTYFVNFGVANPIGELEYTTPPIISLHSPMKYDTFSVNAVLLNFTVAKPDFWLIHGGEEAQQILKGVKYQLDGKFSDPIPLNSGLESPFDYSVNLTNLTDGVHSLKVYVWATGWFIKKHGLREYALTKSSSSDAVYFNVDATPPTILILPVENKTYGTADFPLNFTVNEPVSQVKYSLDGQENMTISGNTTLTGLPNGDHNVTVYATDEAGNTGASETITFSIDVPFPTTMVIAPIASVTVLGVSLVVYFRKRKR